jgi:class 3 adenylate cyclase
VFSVPRPGSTKLDEARYTQEERLGSMRHWLLRRPPHYTDIYSIAGGAPYQFDKVHVDPRIKAGDTIYLIGAQQEMYGWGHVTKVEPYEDGELRKEALKVTVIRVTARHDLVPAKAINEAPAIARLFAKSSLNLHELQPSQVSALNRLLRFHGAEAPADLEGYKDDPIHVRRLTKVFKAATGSRTQIVEILEALKDELTDEEEAWDEADFLRGEGWIEVISDDGPPLARLTYEGQKKAQAALAEEPGKTGVTPSNPQNQSKADRREGEAQKVSVIQGNSDEGRYQLPNVQISEAEAEWLEQLYSAFKKGFKPGLSELKQHLQSQGRWRSGFKPYDIDYRLVENGNEITLIGMWQIEPDTDIVEKCHRVISYIKRVVQRNPQIERIMLNQVADALLLDKQELSRVLNLIRQLGNFWMSATGPATTGGHFVTYDYVEINDPEVVDSYVAYQGIERLVWDFFNKNAPDDNSFKTQDTSADTPSEPEWGHVLFLDIVSYSKLPMVRQTEMLRVLEDCVRSTGEFVRASKAETLISLPTGDGMALAFFGGAISHVRCALELAKALKQHPGLELRMGLHSGAVHRIRDINSSRNVAGGGINTAQRVMDCGDAGHILLSKTVANVLLELGGWEDKLRDLGEVEVKHGVPVHLYNLVDADLGNSAIPGKVEAQRRAKSAAAVPSTQSPPFSNEETAILIAAAEGHILVGYSDEWPDWVRVGERDFMDESDPAVAAMHLEALGSLRRRGLVRQVGPREYELTGSGFQGARELQNRSAEREQTYPEFEEIKINILHSTLAHVIANELKSLKTFLHKNPSLLARGDIQNFYDAWIAPFEIQLEYGASIDLKQEQYEKMKEQLSRIDLGAKR